MAVLVLAALAVFQLLLALGKPLGRYAWGGAHEVLPPKLRVSSAISIVIYAAFALIILGAAGLSSVLPSPVASNGIKFLAGYFFVGIFMNAISRSRCERLVMTPVVAILFVCCAMLL